MRYYYWLENSVFIILAIPSTVFTFPPYYNKVLSNFPLSRKSIFLFSFFLFSFFLFFFFSFLFLGGLTVCTQLALNCDGAHISRHISFLPAARTIKRLKCRAILASGCGRTLILQLSSALEHTGTLHRLLCSRQVTI